MGASESLRKAAGYFGGGSRDDEGYDGYGEYDERPDEHDGTRTLLLVQPARRGFFLAAPHVFDDVQEIGSRFKSDTPVIVDLHGCSPALGERIGDFCGGLVCALDGRVYRIGVEILLLTPRGMDFSSDSGAEAFRHGLFAQA
jgi:cell division inhibitor SepF